MSDDSPTPKVRVEVTVEPNVSDEVKATSDLMVNWFYQQVKQLIQSGMPVPAVADF